MKKNIVARFESPLKVVTPSSAKKREIRASIDQYKNLIPANLNIETDDFLLVYGQAWVSGLNNKNGHVISNESSFKVAKQTPFRFIDIEHKREEGVCGVILNFSFGDYPNNNPKTEDELRASNEPFYVNLLGMVWEAVSPDFYELLKEIQDPKSNLHNAASFSWELSTTEFLICQGSNFLKDAKVVIDPKDEAGLIPFLKDEGGSGMKGGKNIYSLLTDPSFQGVGIVRRPAGHVKPISIISASEKVNENTSSASVVKDKEVSGAAHKLHSTQFNLENGDKLAVLGVVNTIPEEDVYDEEGYGKELEPHITALYGITDENGEDEDIKNKIEKCLNQCGPIECEFGDMSVFSNEDKPYDVLKIDMLGEHLPAINEILKGNLKNNNEYDEYHPHLTLAYVKKGHGDKYVGKKHSLIGNKLKFGSIIYSNTNREHFPINISENKASSQQENPENPLITPILPTLQVPEIIETETSKTPLKNDSLLPANISQNKPNSVIINTQSIDKQNHYIKPYRIMKFENITEFSASLSKSGVDATTVEASVRFIEEELAKRSETFTSKAKEKEEKLSSELKAEQEKLAGLADQVAKIEKDKEDMASKYKELKDKQDEMAKAARFNQRMAEIDLSYDMDDEDHAAITSSVRDMDDACYSSWMSATFKPLARHKLKASKTNDKDKKDGDGKDMKDDKKDEKKADMDDGDEVSKAKKIKEDKKASEDAILAAIKTAEINPKENVMPNGPTQIQKTLKEKYSKATSLDDVSIAK